MHQLGIVKVLIKVNIIIVIIIIITIITILPTSVSASAPGPHLVSPLALVSAVSRAHSRTRLRSPPPQLAVHCNIIISTS